MEGLKKSLDANAGGSLYRKESKKDKTPIVEEDRCWNCENKDKCGKELIPDLMNDLHETDEDEDTTVIWCVHYVRAQQTN